METRKEGITVEFFGPFREYGKNYQLDLEEPVTFEELISRLETRLGPSFGERARRRNTTYILNSRIVEAEKLGSTSVGPGDRVAFALLIGGG